MSQETKAKNKVIGTIVSVNVSNRKGISKEPVDSIELIEGFGVKGDAHGGSIRQVSVLFVESAKEVEGFKPGLFAENITIKRSNNNTNITMGDIIITDSVLLKLTEIGKECPRKCAIYYKLGSCIMPKAGLFFEVVKGGTVKKGDRVEFT